jgi:hypothetical protein
MHCNRTSSLISVTWRRKKISYKLGVDQFIQIYIRDFIHYSQILELLQTLHFLHLSSVLLAYVNTFNWLKAHWFNQRLRSAECIVINKLKH